MAMDVLKAANRRDCFPNSSSLERWQEDLAVDAKFLRDAEGGGDAEDDVSSVGSQAPVGPDAAERLTAKKHLEGALQTVGELLIRIRVRVRISLRLSAEQWEGKKGEHDRLVKEGHKANNAGSAQGAMECFEGATLAL